LTVCGKNRLRELTASGRLRAPLSPISDLRSPISIGVRSPIST